MPCTGNFCDDQHNDKNITIDIKLADSQFYKVYTIDDLFAIFQRNPDATYMLNGGNTAHGNCPLTLRQYVN